MKRWLRYGAVLVGVALILSVAVQLSKSPRTDRIWAPELEKTASATVEDGIVHLSNVRDWTYGVGEIRTREWRAVEAIDPALITRAWFVFEPFPSLPVAGHTYLTFELSDGRAYSFSVEARKEVDEEYSAWKGLWNEYELAYTWGTERDYLTRRLLYLEHPVHMYPLTIDAAGARVLFLSLIDRTNELAEKPRFYNTLTANCTNLLAEMANESAPGSVPYDLSWNLPGYSEKFLQRVGLIPEGKYDLAPYKEEIEGFAEVEEPAFSEQLRMLSPFSRE